MSVAAINWAATAPTETMAQQCVLYVLANHANDRWYTWVSQRTMATESKASRRTVARALDALERLGIIRREKQHRSNGSQTSDVVHLNPDRAETRAERPPPPVTVTTPPSHGDTPVTVIEPVEIAARGDTSTHDTPPAPEPSVPAALTEAARILAERRAARRTDLRNRAGWIHRATYGIVWDHTARAAELLADRPSLTGAELADLLEPTWSGPRPPCSTCANGGTVPAQTDPSKRAPCPACTGRDGPPVPAVELPAEPVAEPEASQPTGPDPWATVPEAGGDASGERVAAGSGPTTARAAYETARRSVSSRPVPELRPSGRVAGSLTSPHHKD